MATGLSFSACTHTHAHLSCPPTGQPWGLVGSQESGSWRSGFGGQPRERLTAFGVWWAAKRAAHGVARCGECCACCTHACSSRLRLSSTTCPIGLRRSATLCDHAQYVRGGSARRHSRLRALGTAGSAVAIGTSLGESRRKALQGPVPCQMPSVEHECRA